MAKAQVQAVTDNMALPNSGPAGANPLADKDADSGLGSIFNADNAKAALDLIKIGREINNTLKGGALNTPAPAPQPNAPATGLPDKTGGAYNGGFNGGNVFDKLLGLIPQGVRDGMQGAVRRDAIASAGRQYGGALQTAVGIGSLAVAAIIGYKFFVKGK